MMTQKQDPMATADLLVSAVRNHGNTGAIPFKSASQLKRTAATNATITQTQEKKTVKKNMRPHAITALMKL
jgi:hypothetical protein